MHIQAILLPHLDKKIAKLHRVEATQLQWRFAAVIPGEPVAPPGVTVFPCGVKTTYRAYSNSMVILVLY